jgi:hypothetical protein
MGYIKGGVELDMNDEWTIMFWMSPSDEHRHVAVASDRSLWIDGDRILKMNWNEEVEWVRDKQLERNMRAIIVGFLLLAFGIFQLLLGFASLFYFGGDSMATILFMLGGIVGGMGLTALVLGIINDRKKG